MSKNLPEIPNEVWVKLGPGTDGLEEAWPILYAAALRHAADVLYRSWGDDQPPHWVESLRRMADEALRG